MDSNFVINISVDVTGNIQKFEKIDENDLEWTKWILGVKEEEEATQLANFGDLDDSIFNNVLEELISMEQPTNYFELEQITEYAITDQNHAKAVARHMRDLSAKSYWSQFDETVDFVVLYIEVEPAFGAALMVQKNLLSEAVSNRIVFATPTTLIALLQTVAYSWKQHTATENADKIWKSGKELFERLVVFTEYLQKLGGTLSSAVKTYNQAVGSWESRVMPGVKKLESLGGGSEKKTLKDLEKIDVVPRNEEM